MPKKIVTKKSATKKSATRKSAVKKSETHNLVTVGQKLFNLGLSTLVRSYPTLPDYLTLKRQIKECTSITALQRVLIKFPQLRKVICQLQLKWLLLQSIVKGKGEFCNTAAALKHYNFFINLVWQPNLKNISWTTEVETTRTRRPEISAVFSQVEQPLAVQPQVQPQAQPQAQQESQSEVPEQCQNYEQQYHPIKHDKYGLLSTAALFLKSEKDYLNELGEFESEEKMDWQI